MLFAFLANSGSLALGGTYDRAAHSAAMTASGVPYDQQLTFMSMASVATPDQKQPGLLLNAYDWMVATFGEFATWLAITCLVAACGIYAVHLHKPRQDRRRT